MVPSLLKVSLAFGTLKMRPATPPIAGVRPVARLVKPFTLCETHARSGPRSRGPGTEAGFCPSHDHGSNPSCHRLVNNGESPRHVKAGTFLVILLLQRLICDGSRPAAHPLVRRVV